VWTSHQVSRLPLYTLFALLALGGCSDTPTEAPVQEAPPPEVEILSDLDLNLTNMLVDTPADLEATMKFALPPELSLESAGLYRVDEADEPVELLCELRDDGSAESGDCFLPATSGHDEALI